MCRAFRVIDIKVDNGYDEKCRNTIRNEVNDMFHMMDKIKNGEVYVIAEMSANHGGSLENALKIVREVATTGADCLKIQTYTADSMTIDCDSDLFIFTLVLTVR